MTTFVVRNNIQIFFGENERTLRADKDLVKGLIETVLRNRLQVAAGSQQCGFVDQVRQVRANHTWSGTGDGNEVDILRKRYVTRVNLENCQAAIPVRAFYGDTAVEAPRTQQRLIQAIRPVGGADNDHRLVGIKAIHLNEQLV